MINLLLFLLFIACAGIAASLLVENSGSVTMLWFDYQIETSVAFLVISVFLAVAFIMLCTLVIRNIIYAPSRFWKSRNVKQLKQGISELTYSVAALAASDVATAEKHTRKVEKLMGRTPLTLLLSAQIAKSRGEEEKTQDLLEKLLEYEETKYLAARFLSDGANKQQNLPKALNLAKMAHGVNPKDSAASIAVVSLEVRLNRWHEALAHLDEARLSRSEKKHIRALIQIERGKLLLDDGRYEEALYLARSAFTVLPDFVPAIALVALAYNENDKEAKALSILSSALKKQPSRILFELLQQITEHEEPERREKILAKFSVSIIDGIWHCKSCNHEQKDWKIHCDSCHDFDSLEWK